MTKKVVLITGGSAGIGLATMEKFLKEGNTTVYNLDLQTPPINADHHISCDLTSSEQITDAVEQIAAKEHAIDVLVSNAGVHFSGTIETSTLDDYQRVMDTNVRSAFLVLKAVIPVMKNADHGSIVLVSSEQALVGKPRSCLYGMSKAAIASLAKSTALDYAQHNIRVNAVCPGTIETPLYHQAIDNYCEKTGAKPEVVHQAEAALQPLGRIGQPQEIADFIYFLTSEQAGFITGSLQVIDGGYTTG